LLFFTVKISLSQRRAKYKDNKHLDYQKENYLIIIGEGLHDKDIQVIQQKCWLCN